MAAPGSQSLAEQLQQHQQQQREQQQYAQRQPFAPPHKIPQQPVNIGSGAVDRSLFALSPGSPSTQNFQLNTPGGRQHEQVDARALTNQIDLKIDQLTKAPADLLIDSKEIKDRLASFETQKLDQKSALDKEADPWQAAQPTGSTFDPWKARAPPRVPRESVRLQT